MEGEATSKNEGLLELGISGDKIVCFRPDFRHEGMLVSPLLSTCMHVPFQVLLPGSRDPYEGPVSSPWFWPPYFSPEPRLRGSPGRAARGRQPLLLRADQ